jgi:hypothetical protein
MKPTPEMIEAAREAVPMGYFIRSGNRFVQCGISSDDAELALTAALALVEPGEPVAWQCEYGNYYPTAREAVSPPQADDWMAKYSKISTYGSTAHIKTIPLDEPAQADHARGCPGREYVCTCGYDDGKDALIRELVAAMIPVASYVSPTHRKAYFAAIARAKEAGYGWNE